MHREGISFAAEIDAWDGKADKTLAVGTTSDVLQSIGVQKRGIVWHSRKLGEILRKHNNMSIDIVKKVPEILEDPIIVLKSMQSDSRIAIFGEVVDKSGAPVTTILELQPTNRGGELLNMNVIASVYGKNSNLSGFIRNSNLLYLDPNKNRTGKWLQGLGLQLPSDTTSLGSIGTITYQDGNVKIAGVPFHQYMRNSGKYLPGVLEPKGIMAAINANVAKIATDRRDTHGQVAHEKHTFHGDR